MHLRIVVVLLFLTLLISSAAAKVSGTDLSPLTEDQVVKLTPPDVQAKVTKGVDHPTFISIATDPRVEQLGQLFTGLLCGCMQDDSCDQATKDLCDPLGQIPGLGSGFLQPLASGLSDPSVAMCQLGRYATGGTVPPGVNALQLPALVPDVPTLAIEAVRWNGDSGAYGYALDYRLDINSSYSDYSSISFEVRGSSTRDVVDLASVEQPSSSSDLPFDASFSSDELFTRACITFQKVPDGMPDSLCVPIREVQAS